MKLSAWMRRAVHAVRKYFRRVWDADDLLNFNDIAPFIRSHLARFYFMLLCASACSTFGCYLHSTGNTRSSITVLGTFTSIVCFLRSAPWKTRKRGCFLILASFFGGALVTHCLSWFLNVNPSIVITSLLATTVGFGCFWASNWSHRFLLVYYRALLVSVLLLLFSVLIDSAVFGRDIALLRFQLHVLVLWFMVYVAVYSQEVVFKARTDADYVQHAASLYVDFPAIVLHVIMIFFRLFRKEGHRRNR